MENTKTISKSCKVEVEKDVLQFYEISIFGQSPESPEIEESITMAVSAAYPDMARRTLTGLSDKNDPLKDKLKSKLIDFLTNKIKLVLQNFSTEIKGQPNFDVWHEKICNALVKLYRETKNEKGENIKFTYGHAQKVVNMGFKYLYCLCSTYAILDNYESCFVYCHIPIDENVLKAIKSRLSSKPKDGEYIKDLAKVRKIIAWSKIDNYADYKELQVIARKLYENPFKEDFKIWKR